ncbi:MAG: lipopolysaccharide transport protein [Wigglesworthia glossinidia]|nr:lipopolysaccharide transport protein [Wigglesworthia glossinidia]
MKNKHLLIIFCILFCKITLANYIKTEKIQIYSHNQIFDISSKKVIFTEKVQLKYKNFIMQASKIIFIQKKNAKNFLEGYGAPIILNQIEKNKIIMQISCLRIRFNITDKVLFLSENVNLKQENGTIISDNIIINLKNNTVQAKGNSNKQIKTILTFK